MPQRTSGPYSSAYEVAAKPPFNPWRWSWLVAFVLLLIWIGSVEPRPGVTPSCPTNSLLGFPCPGCGSLRAMHALVGGDIATAWDYNAFTTLLLPFVGLLTLPPVRDAVSEVHDRHPSLASILGFGLVAGGIAYWATRVF